MWTMSSVLTWRPIQYQIGSRYDPGPDGIELLKTIRTLDPDLPILVLSMHAESVYAERALRAGANGYIMKQEATDNVLDALRRIIRQASRSRWRRERWIRPPRERR